MYQIVKKQLLAPEIYLMDILAPRVAKSAQPGQFVITVSTEWGERIPLTICDYDRNADTVTIVFQVVGNSTMEMSEMNEGDSIADFVGPLGQPSEWLSEPINELKQKKFIFIGGGVGTAPIYPQVKWLSQHGIRPDVIIGARTKELLILTEEMKQHAEVHISTDDGSFGFNGRVTDLLKHLVQEQEKHYDLCISIGPMIMMKFVTALTKELDIPTIVSLNPIMVDGTGMCGACRVSIGDQVKFACVDGPEFNGHLVDFDEAMRRQTLYKSHEGRKELRRKEGDTHKPATGCGTQKKV